MTITLPNDPSIGDGYDPVPGNNNSAPPTGAPEGNATSTVNDIQRNDKAAIKQNAENLAAINAALGTMAEQDANAVNITGGTIGAAVGVAEAANATTLAGNTLTQIYQTIYDGVWPVGSRMYFDNVTTPPPLPPGVVATWTKVSGGTFVKLANMETPGSSGGFATPACSVTGSVDGTAITEAQMPGHTHSLAARNTNPADEPPSPTELIADDRGVGGVKDYEFTRSTDQTPATFSGRTSTTGSGATHNHTATLAGTVTEEPLHTVLAQWLRTA